MAITCSQSSSRNCTRRLSLRHAGIGDQNVELAHRLLGARHQSFRLDRIGEIAGQDMDALTELARELIEHFAPGAGNGDRRTLRCRVRAIAPPIGPVAPVTSAVFPVSSNICLLPNAEIAQPRPALNRAMSSGVPIDEALAASAMRLIKPVETLPAPIS